MNIRSIAKKIKKKSLEEEQQINKKIQKAYKEIIKLKKDFLKVDKNIKKIILFGSLAENNVRSFNFDIDIAVQSKKYYCLVGIALQSSFKVDVVDLDTVHENIKKNILKYGKTIYEQKTS